MLDFVRILSNANDKKEKKDKKKPDKKAGSAVPVKDPAAEWTSICFENEIKFFKTRFFRKFKIN